MSKFENTYFYYKDDWRTRLVEEKQIKSIFQLLLVFC
jgi:hypothetical protein